MIGSLHGREGQPIRGIRPKAPFIAALGCAAALTSTAVKAAPSAIEFVCHPAEKHLCSAGHGCKASVVTVFAKFSSAGPGRATYSRCDRHGCDRHEANTYQSGAFLNIELPGRATFAKVGPNGEWTEVVSLGNDVIVAQGKCLPEASRPE